MCNLIFSPSKTFVEKETNVSDHSRKSRAALASLYGSNVCKMETFRPSAFLFLSVWLLRFLASPYPGLNKFAPV